MALLVTPVLAFGQEYDLTWDHEIVVDHGPEMFDGDSLYAYSTLAYEIRRNDLRKMLLDEVKDFTGDKATKKALTQGLKVTLPAFKGEDVAVRIKSDDLKETNDVRIAIAFLKGTESVNPTDYPKGHDAALTVMHNVGVLVNKSVVEVQVADAQEQLEDLENELESVVKDRSGTDEVIREGDDDLAKLAIDNRKLEEKLSKAQAQAASLEVMAKASAATAKDMQKYTKAQSKASGIESKMLKNNQKQLKLQSEITEAKSEQPLLDQRIEELNAAIESHKEIVAKLEAKLDAIM